MILSARMNEQQLFAHHHEEIVKEARRGDGRTKGRTIQFITRYSFSNIANRNATHSAHDTQTIPIITGRTVSRSAQSLADRRLHDFNLFSFPFLFYLSTMEGEQSIVREKDTHIASKTYGVSFFHLHERLEV
jgi:hypothetical protein